MSTNCDRCGYRDNEVKSGSAISEQGRRITLQVEDREDLSRDILKVCNHVGISPCTTMTPYRVKHADYPSPRSTLFSKPEHWAAGLQRSRASLTKSTKNYPRRFLPRVILEEMITMLLRSFFKA